MEETKLTYENTDYSEWSIQDFITEGINITRNAQEGDALYGDKFIAVDVHSRFVIWREWITKFLIKKDYLNESSPVFSLAESLLEADSVPHFKGGIEYGIPDSEKSQILLKNIREETKKKIEILRDIRAYENGMKSKNKTNMFNTLDVNEEKEINITYNINIGQFTFNNNKSVELEGKQKDTADCLVNAGKEVKVSWDEIYDNMRTIAKATGEILNQYETNLAKKSVNGAVSEINKKTEKYLYPNKLLIGFKESEYWLQYKITKNG